MSIRVVIIDDHPVVRDGLRFRIEQSGKDILVVGEAGDGQELLTMAPSTLADVYVMDVTMPNLNGIEATRELLRDDPAAKVIMLSLHSSDSVVLKSLRAGARGFLTKESATRCIVDAICDVNLGRYYISPDVAQSVVRAFLRTPGDPTKARVANPLTPRERRVLQLLAEGNSSKEVATMLSVSVNTINKHRTNLMAKLNIHSQVELVRYALREGMAKP